MTRHLLIFLLSILLSAQSLNAAVIVYTDFEAQENALGALANDVTVKGTATYSISSTVAKSGTYCFQQASAADGDYIMFINWVENLGGALTDYYVCFDLYIDTALYNDFVGNHSEFMGIWGTMTDGYANQCTISLQENSSLPALILEIDRDNSTESFTMSADVTANVWHHVKAYIKEDTDNTNGIVKGWYDGSLVVNESGKDVVNSTEDGFYIGANFYGNEVTAGNMYLDNFGMADTDMLDGFPYEKSYGF